MNNRCKNTTLIFSIIFATFFVNSFKTVSRSLDFSVKTPKQELSLSEKKALSEEFFKHSYFFTIAQNDRVTCQKLPEKYKEIYAFETQNFYINICRINGNFFYYRQSKADSNDRVLIPARPVFGGDVFQAIRGKTTYFVGLEDRGYYSSVMYNNNEIVFEPEIQSPSATLAEDRATLSASPSNMDRAKLSRQSINVNSSEIAEDLASYPSDRDDENRSKTCTKDREDVRSHLNGWQEFIGQSPQVIGKYATENGHDFIYSSSAPTQAFIETADGLIVDLNIATFSKTVEGVCVTTKI